ncbi:MAG: hypothetical protein QOI79_3272 [Mycobacterium sp.]|nr:hypothetical protein [Mycobacterium sp.]
MQWCQLGNEITGQFSGYTAKADGNDGRVAVSTAGNREDELEAGRCHLLNEDPVDCIGYLSRFQDRGIGVLDLVEGHADRDASDVALVQDLW